ncbi:MAG: hypothetical protein RMY28_007465 [Nostoc sp. ChiSLP01]
MPYVLCFAPRCDRGNNSHHIGKGYWLIITFKRRKQSNPQAEFAVLGKYHLTCWF